MTWIPCSASQSPNQPVLPYTSTSASPTTTGEIANGRSISSPSSALPRKRPRSSSSAMPIPKTVFSGTAIATISSDSQNACWALGAVTASHTGAEAVFEGAVEDHRHRREQQQRRDSRARPCAARAARPAGPSGLLRRAERAAPASRSTPRPAPLEDMPRPPPRSTSALRARQRHASSTTDTAAAAAGFRSGSGRRCTPSRPRS